MATLQLKMTPQALKKLEKVIQKQVADAAKDIVTTCMKEIVDATPMNSGRTLASWRLFKNVKGSYDADTSFPGEFFYDADYLPKTNDLPIGSEPNRSFWADHAMKSINSVDFKDPYNKFYITNGAGLDSIADSTLTQAPGGRAALLDAGEIPAFDLYTGKGFVFDPRADGFFGLTARNKINEKLRKRRSQK